MYRHLMSVAMFFQNSTISRVATAISIVLSLLSSSGLCWGLQSLSYGRMMSTWDEWWLWLWCKEWSQRGEWVNIQLLFRNSRWFAEEIDRLSIRYVLDREGIIQYDDWLAASGSFSKFRFYTSLRTRTAPVPVWILDTPQTLDDSEPWSIKKAFWKFRIQV